MRRTRGFRCKRVKCYENHCYENAQAERLNGILKQEYGLGETFARKGDVIAAVREAVGLYNHHRPHEALAYRIPMRVHESAASSKRKSAKERGQSPAPRI